MIYFTSDLHFGHDGVIEYCKRPFKDATEMAETLVKRWNERVKPTDTVYVIGDLSLCKFSEFEPYGKQLNGTKFLVKGNHDHYTVSQYNKLGFTVILEAKIAFFGKIFRLSHYPYAMPWYKRPFAYKSELRFMELRPPKIKGEFLIHGHTHMPYKRRDNMIHVGVDAWNFYPVSMKELESLVNKGSKSSKNNNLKKKT